MPGPKTTAQTKSLLSVTQAAKILKVSPDTLRNWEKSGKLIPERTPGGARRYRLSFIQELVSEKAPEVSAKKKGMLSISKAAKELGVSSDTLRNWEKKGQISADRTEGGARRYSKSQLTFLKKELGIDNKQAQSASPIVISKNTNTISQESGLQASLMGASEIMANNVKLYEQSKIFSRSSFSIFRLALPILIVFLFALPVAFLGFTDPDNKEKGLEQKVYDLAGNVEKIQNSLFNMASENGDVKSLPKSAKDVLAVSSIINFGKFLEINADTSITGSIAVEGQGIFVDNITAPNIVYSLIAGSNVTISGDSQNPVISANPAGSNDTLASVTARGANTNTPVSLLGGATLGNLLTFGQLSTDPSSGTNGSIYYNTTDNKYRCYIDGSWEDCDTDTVNESSTGDIEGVTAGVGLTGGGDSGEVSLEIALTTSGSSVITSSNSGLEVGTAGISLIRGCSSGQVLKWNGTDWICAADAGGAGSSTVQEGGVTVSSAIDTYNYIASDFDISASLTTATVAIDYTNSGITRRGNTETVSGAWSFADLTISDPTISLTGATTTLTSVGSFTLSPGGAVLLGDGGDTFAINSSDWDVSTTGAITGATYEGLTIATTTGSLAIANGKTYTVNNTVTFDGTDGTTFTFPATSGTVCTTTTCLTAGSGVTSLNGLTGILTLANSSGLGTTVTIDNAAADGTTKGIATFNATNFTATSGVINTIQNINTAATPTFAGLNLTGLSASSAVYTDGSKNLTSTAPTSGAIGYWSRTGTTLSPTTANDIATISTNAATGNALALTSSAITTSGSAGFTNTSTFTGTGSGDSYYGSRNIVDSSVALTGTTAQNYYGSYISLAKTGADTTSGSINSYGIYADVTNTGGNTAATRGTYGGRFVATGSVAGSTTSYGIAAFGVDTDTTVGLNGQSGANSAITVATAYGVLGQAFALNGGTVTDANGGTFQNYLTGTLTTSTGVSIFNPNSVGGTISSNYGLYVGPMTSGASDYGARIDAAQTQTLWVSGNANNTTAAAGIAFGSSRDTNLYRSAADTLKTDDAFNVNGNFNVTSAGAISAATGISSSGTINFSTLTASSAVYTDASKNLTSTAPTSGAIGYWSRTSTTLSPTTANDVVSVTSNVTASPLMNLSTSGVFTGTTTNSVVPVYANAATTGDIMTISGTGLTTGSALVLAGASGTGMTDALVKVSGNVGNMATANGLISSTANLNGGGGSEGVNLYLRTNINTSSASGGYGIYNSLVDATSNGNVVTSYFGNTQNTGNTSKALYGTWNTVSTNSTAWDNLISFVGVPYTNSSAVITTGTRLMTAYYAAPGSTALSTGGTTNIKGFQYITNGTLTVGVGGTLNVAGFYAGNPTMNTTGTTAKFGLQFEDYSVSPADENYAVCFDCDGTYTTSSAINGLTWGNDANSVTLYRSASDTLKTDDAFNVNGTANISSAGAISGLTGYSQLAGSFTLTPDGTNDVNITIANASGRYLNIAGLATGTATNGLCLDASNNVITCTYGGGSGTVTETGTNVANQVAYFTADQDITSANSFVYNPTAPNVTDSANLLVQGTLDRTSTYQAGLYANPTINPGSASTATYQALKAVAYSTSTNLLASALRGMESAVYFQPSSAATLSEAFGGFFKNYAANIDATIINSYGAYVANPDSTGTITTNYGLYLENQTGGDTTNYALYSAGGQSYFAGNVGIGDTTPAAALTVGAGDAFQVNSSGNIIGIGGVAHSVANSSGELLIDSDGSRIIFADDLQLLGTGTITDSNNNEAIVINSTTSAVNHIKIFNAAAGNAVSISAVGDDTNVALNLDGQLTGQINIGNNSTGDILLGGGSGSTGCTVTNASGDFACTGNITGASTGTVGYWSRTGTTLSPATSGDNVTTSGNISTTSSGTLTVAGTTNLNGTIGLGDATGDTITFTGYVGSNILPSTDDTYNLGDDTHRWANLFLGGETIHIGASTTDEGTISYTIGNILSFGTDATTNGDIAFFTDDLYLDKSAGFIGIGDTSPAAMFTVGSGDLFQVNSSGNVIFNQTAPTMTIGNTGSLTINDGTNPLVEFNDDQSDEGKITLYGFQGSQKSISMEYEDGGAGDGYFRFISGGTNGTIAEFRDCCNPVFTVGGTNTASEFGYGLIVGNQESDTGNGLAVNFNQADDGDASDIGSALQVNVTSSSVDADTLYGVDIANITGGIATETAIHIGTGWNNFLDTANIDISAAGAITGATGLTSSGTINFSGLTASSAVYTDGSKNLTSTAPTSGAIGYWSRSGTSLSPATANDVVSLASNVTASPLLNLSTSGIFTGTGTNSLLPLYANSATTGDIFSLSATALTSGTAMTLTGPTGGTAGVTNDFMKITSDVQGNGKALLALRPTFDNTAGGFSNYGLFVDASDATSIGNALFAITADLTLTGNGPKGGTAVRGAVTSTSTTGDLLNGGYFFADHNTAVTTGNTELYGVNAAALNDGITDTNAATTYGGYFLSMGNTGGTGSTAYGLYASASGADNNYGLIIPSGGGSVGIGTAVPTALLHVIGTAPVSVATTPGTTAGVALTIAGAAGGATTNANGTGGAGSAISLTTGIGGAASGATSIVGGTGGAFAITAGAGGNVSTGTTRQGGTGGSITLTAGAGGSGNSAATAIGGNISILGGGNSGTTGHSNGGNVYIAGGPLSNAGTNGNVLLGITSAGTIIGNVGIGTTAPTGKLQVVNSALTAASAATAVITSTSTATAGNGQYGLISAFTNSPTSTANTAIALSASVSDASGLLNTTYGIASSTSITGAMGAGTRSTMGIVSTPASTASSDTGSHNIYGAYLGPSDTLGTVNTGSSNSDQVFGAFITNTATYDNDCTTNCSLNQYGLYVANGTSSTNGTTKKYGIYVESPTGADTNIAAVFAGGNVGIGDTTPDFTLDVKGTICQDTDSNDTCDGTVTSDSRLKMNVADISNPLEKIGQLRGVNFNYKQDTIYGNALPANRQLGFIAQEVEQVIPEVIYEDMNGYKLVDYQKITALLASGVNELNQKVDKALLTINDQGYADKEFKAKKLTITSDANITGTITAGNYAIDATKLNRTGSLATITVSQTQTASIADAVNALNESQKSQENRLASVETKTASQSTVLADQSIKLENTAVKADQLETKVTEQKSALDLFKDQIQSQIDQLSGTGESSSSAVNNPVLTAPDELISTGSAQLAEFTANTISGNTVNISESLTSLGETRLANTVIAGDLIQDGTFSITNGNEINVIGTGTENDGILFIQRSPLASSVNFFDGLFTLDKSGSFKAPSVTVANFKVVANKISGSGTIKAGEKSIIIDNPLVKQNARILVTPTSANNVILAVTEKTDDQSFIVSTAFDSTTDITFDWWMVQEVEEE